MLTLVTVLFFVLLTHYVKIYLALDNREYDCKVLRSELKKEKQRSSKLRSQFVELGKLYASDHIVKKNTPLGLLLMVLQS